MKVTFKANAERQSVCATLDKAAADRLVLLYNNACQKNVNEGKDWWVPDAPKNDETGTEMIISSPRARKYIEIIIEMARSGAENIEDERMFDALMEACDYYQSHFVQFFRSHPNESGGWTSGEQVF